MCFDLRKTIVLIENQSVALGTCRFSVRKVVSQSKFTEQIFTSQTEQNFQMRAQIILLL